MDPLRFDEEAGAVVWQCTKRFRETEMGYRLPACGWKGRWVDPPLALPWWGYLAMAISVAMDAALIVVAS